MRRRRLRWVLAGLVVFAAAVWANNSSLLVDAPAGRPQLLAHRGLGQTFDSKGVSGDTCTASRIHPPTHPYLENTIASMQAAFDAGADMVELDVHPTRDGQFAVFHDWTLECRTNGTGVVRDKTMAELRTLDVGYGYTADGGRTYPFRGKGVGLIPTLDEALTRFADRQLLIHVKSDDAAEGDQLARRLAALPAPRRAQLSVYGGDKPIASLARQLPDLRVMSKATMKRCLIQYTAIGWTGYVPAACRHTQLHLPEGIAPWLWGWPNRFPGRMSAVDTRVILVAGDGGFSEGFDQASDVQRLPSPYPGWVWTNRVDLIAPKLRP